jgi:cobalt-zinc-cadmium efflux system outer membrane protein
LPDVAPSDVLTRDAESRAVRASIDLAMGQRQLDQARERESLARAEGWVPGLKAGVSAERGEEGWGIGPAAEVELPLFYQGQGETDSALAAARQQQRMLAHTAVAVRATARSLATRLSAAEQSLGFYERTVLPLRKRVLDQAQLQYNAMQIGVFQLLAAKREATVAEQKRLALLEEYWVARNELERLLAGKLGSERPSAALSAPAGAAGATTTGH